MTTRPNLKISLRRENGTDWTKVGPSTSHLPVYEPGEAPKQLNTPTRERTTPSANATAASSVVVASVAKNVSSFLNGIRASFRQDNVNVSANIRNQKSITENPNHDG